MEGSARVNIPAGVQSGVLLRLRGQGLPELNGNGRRGDLLVRVLVYTPQKLSHELKEHFRQLKEMEEPAPDTMDGDRKGFWSKVKEAFTA